MSHGADYCNVCYKDMFISSRIGGCACSDPNTSKDPRAEVLLKALKNIRQEELDSQRPGGYMSKSAMIADKAIKEYESEIKK